MIVDKTVASNSISKLFLRAVVAVAVMLTALHIPGMASAELLLSVEDGNSWDPLVGAKPMFNWPDEIQSTKLSVAESPFGPQQFTGPVRLYAECCKDAITRNPIVPAGFSVEVTPYATCLPEARLALPDRPDRPGVEPGLRDLVPPPCQSATDTTVTIPSVGTQASAFFRVITGSSTPGAFIATVKSDSSLGTTSKEVFVSVVARALPPDGPFPACVATSSRLGGVSTISLASISRDPFVWKRANPTNLASTMYAVGIAIGSTAGLTAGFSNLGTTGPDPTMSSISFTNTEGWPVAVRTVDSRNCATPAQTVTVAAGETKSISLSSASTTTLVFSKSTCRAFINLFNCWGGNALGLDDLAVFSAGPFWTLFGGRMVSLSTVGDWSKIPVADSIATVKTQ